ncbi:hypothetical protein KKF55_02570 [Patescibacteria group bacterium]|nr:hypothetical protein [Patescibacteria group bacterium]
MRIFKHEYAQWVLLALFVLAVFCLIMFPVLLMGYPYSIADTIQMGRVLAETGQIIDTSSRLVLVAVAVLYPVIGLQNVIAWTAVSVATFCLALFPWWWCVSKLFDERVAWFSTVVFALTPIYWVEAYALGGYSFAIFFLFITFAVFIRYHSTKPFLAVILCGLFFGATMASRDSFQAFLPWLMLGYLWHGRRQVIPAIVRIGLFCIAAYFMFMLPMLPHALQPDMSSIERVMVFAPTVENATKPGVGHLYPDKFIYEFYKEEYDAEMLERVENDSFLHNQLDRQYRILFKVGEFDILDTIGTGLWLFVNTIPAFIMQDWVGGAFLWLFVFPGILVMWRTRRSLLMYIFGIWFTVEFLLRFILHFARLHLNDYGWALALFAGLGVSAIVGGLSQSWRLTSRMRTMLSIFVICVIGMQMIQANRKVLAFHYSRSSTQETYAATEALKKIPDDAVVANPGRNYLFFLSPQTRVSVHPISIQFLSERGKLHEPFEYFRVTHIIGFTKEQEVLIKKVAPNVEVVPMPEDLPGPPLTPLVRYILHLVR